MAAMASPRALPTATCPNAAAKSLLARSITPRRSPAAPATCLYNDGGRTPRRAATAETVRSSPGCSSSIAAAVSITTAALSPALATGMHPPEEVEYGFRCALGLLCLRIVTGVVDHRDLPVKRGPDPSGLRLGIVEVGIVAAHDYQHRRPHG